MNFLMNGHVNHVKILMQKSKRLKKKSYQHGGKYPQYLEVRMDDGSLVIYTKSNIAKE